MIAVVIGSTGLVGSTLIPKLLADPSIERVISVSRKSIQLKNTKLAEVLIPSLNDLPSVAAKLRGDIYFCCLGTTIKTAGSKESFRKVDHDAVFAFADIAKNHNARTLLLVSAMGANSNSTFFYNRVKGDAEESLKALKLNALYIFRPALLMGERKEFRLGEKIAATIATPLTLILPKKVMKSALTNVEHLADVMVQASKGSKPGLHIINASEI